MVQFLINCQCKSNISPPALPTRSINAVMFTITKSTPWLRGFDLLGPHSNLSLRTPIFGCHILHSAVATFDFVLFNYVIPMMGGLKSIVDVSPTNLGNTVLHM